MNIIKIIFSTIPTIHLQEYNFSLAEKYQTQYPTDSSIHLVVYESLLQLN